MKVIPRAFVLSFLAKYLTKLAATLGGASLIGGLYRKHKARRSREASQLSQLSQFFERWKDGNENSEQEKNDKVVSHTSWLRNISKISATESRNGSLTELKPRRESSLRRLSNFLRNR